MAISGELNVVTADGFADRALAAVYEQSDSLAQDPEEPLSIDYRGVGEWVEMTRQSDGERPRSLVVDLSGLQFIDCAGTRALTDLISVVPVAWPVLMYRAGAPVRRVFDVLGFHLGSPPGRADGLYVRPVQDLIDESQAVRLKARILRAQTRELRELIATAEDQLTSTLTRMAEHRPHAADRLTTLSYTARQRSVSLRR